jgi:hypothetical protein
MAAWQYAQLAITRDSRAGADGLQILWHGPGQGIAENFSDSGQTILELMNRVGADGWELAGWQEQQVHGDGPSYWDPGQALTTYTFKREVPQ